MRTSWPVLPLALWSATVVGLFYWLQRVPPEKPCDDVIFGQAACAAPEPLLEGHWTTTYGVAVVLSMTGAALVFFICRRQPKQDRPA